MLINTANHHKDKRKVVDLTTSLELIILMEKNFKIVYPSLIPTLKYGEILIDTRRVESLQGKNTVI